MLHMLHNVFFTRYPDTHPLLFSILEYRVGICTCNSTHMRVHTDVHTCKSLPLSCISPWLFETNTFQPSVLRRLPLLFLLSPPELKLTGKDMTISKSRFLQIWGSRGVVGHCFTWTVYYSVEVYMSGAGFFFCCQRKGRYANGQFAINWTFSTGVLTVRGRAFRHRHLWALLSPSGGRSSVDANNLKLEWNHWH